MKRKKNHKKRDQQGKINIHPKQSNTKTIGCARMKKINNYNDQQ
jgi:hypothetical protein